MTRRAIGDIYEVILDADCRGYFQHVANDSTQMNASVIRVFAARNPTDVSNLPAAEVAFHIHAGLVVGERLNIWRKAAHSAVTPPVDLCFRMCEDYGDPTVTISRKWNTWRLNQPMRRIGRLDERARQFEIGLIVNPLSIVHRMKTGSWDFAIPS